MFIFLGKALWSFMLILLLSSSRQANAPQRHALPPPRYSSHAARFEPSIPPQHGNSHPFATAPSAPSSTSDNQVRTFLIEWYVIFISISFWEKNILEEFTYEFQEIVWIYICFLFIEILEIRLLMYHLSTFFFIRVPFID